MFQINIENLKTLKYHIFLKTTIDLSIANSNCGNECKKILKEEESIEILKFIGLITNIEVYQKIYNHV